MPWLTHTCNLLSCLSFEEIKIITDLMKWIMQTTHEMVLGLKPLQNNFSMMIQVVLDVMLTLFTNIY